MVELLPLDAVECCVSEDRTETREGLGRLARLSARRCREPCFCLAVRRARAASSIVRERCRTGACPLTDPTVELLGRFGALVSLPSSIRPSLGKKPPESFSFGETRCSEEDGFGDEELWGDSTPEALRKMFLAPFALRELHLSQSSHRLGADDEACRFGGTTVETVEPVSLARLFTWSGQLANAGGQNCNPPGALSGVDVGSVWMRRPS